MPELQPKKGIVFGAQSSVKSQAFPENRTYRWAPAAARGAEPPDVALVVSQEVLALVNRHVSERLDREIGGFLLGNRYRCPQTRREFVMIDQATPAQFTEANAVSLAFTPEAWARLDDELNGKFNGKLLVGWYHSHPKLGVFLSQSDFPIHEQRFSEPWKSALVIDPANRQGAFFARRRGRLDANVPVEFHEYLSGPVSAMPATQMIWNGYTAHDPASGRTLSPVPVKSAGAGPLLLDAGHDQSTAERGPLPSPEIISQPFPLERSYRWIPKAAIGAPPADVAILVAQDVLRAVQVAVAESLEYEIGGFLLGNNYRCPNTGLRYVIIDQYSPAKFTEQNSVSLAFTAAAWGKLADDLTGKFYGKMLVGWYHSHPKMGIFLSSWDVELHQKRFSDVSMSALVIDPQKQIGGFFCRRGGRLDPRLPVEFYELREGGGDMLGESTIPWSDHMARDPVTGVEMNPPREKFAAPLATSNDSQLPPATGAGIHFPGAHRRPKNRIGLAAAVAAVTVGAVIGGYFMWRPSKTQTTEHPFTQLADVKVEVDDAKYTDPDHPDEGVTFVLSIKPRRALDETVVEIEGQVADTVEVPADTDTVLRVQVHSNTADVVNGLKRLKQHPASNPTARIRVLGKTLAPDKTTRETPLATADYPLSKLVELASKEDKKKADSQAKSADPRNKPSNPQGNSQPPNPRESNLALNSRESNLDPKGTNSPPDPKGTNPPPDPKGTNPPPDPKGTNPPPDPKGTNPPPDPKGTNPPPDPKGTNPPPDPKGTNPPPDPKGTNPPLDPKGTNRTPDPKGINPPPDPKGTNQPSDPKGTNSPSNPINATPPTTPNNNKPRKLSPSEYDKVKDLANRAEKLSEDLRKCQELDWQRSFCVDAKNGIRRQATDFLKDLKRQHLAEFPQDTIDTYMRERDRDSSALALFLKLTVATKLNDLLTPRQ